ncbi:glutamine transport ATP-binding protein GlnQ [Lentilactobacillus kosonis]|uniref:Glutamine transport ATP-binding protein GlnQ n=1 Tax=Lentilactobacillus kosonis TaxID=2810561 RepID=A0A401FLX1_9LACO|nr:glutamine transport ATP-binding protein GlnQ [Lentilactobacillus kosonis]
MAMIEFDDVQKYYGDFHALKDINLKIEDGETVVLIGPSGSGKSTLIRTVNGLEPVQDGRLIVNGQDLQTTKPILTGLEKMLEWYSNTLICMLTRQFWKILCWLLESC